MLSKEIGELSSLKYRAKNIDEPRLSRTQFDLFKRRINDFSEWVHVRPSPAAELPEGLTATAEGCKRIYDFYRFTNSSEHPFDTRETTKAQCFRKFDRKNIAILEATKSDTDSSPLFLNFAVSGENTVGVKVREDSVLQAIECRKNGGTSFNRRFDAEFKLANCLASTIENKAGYTGTINLWSMKELCESCDNVVNVQLPGLLPGATINVITGSDEKTESRE
ncbi:deaminase domain-containing protein [Endozoicomonas euniceicola]|uniref:Uncharacterized protein n=1 Tax=Endozoicomonas euniceicola TaxID=1234143 RepID=A0ABY6GWT7_9GAMM|nr:deaminase domain-containing protein [Endozoicomonas euniceicola]UYM16444.1 hypothetical protein NX720_00475 [Endozoicomonas euniceicola]